MGEGWTHAICEVCWIEQNATWDEEGRLTGIGRPLRFKEPEIERCCFCGNPTIFGVYIRFDPQGVTYCEHRERKSRLITPGEAV
jgi:hypothetical protein